jgi:hypothetical protein
MTPSMRNFLLIVLNAAIWGLNGLMIKGTLRLSAKLGIPVAVDIEPSRVRLTVDGNPWDGAGSSQGWIKTPANINLPAGQHKMLVERPGYASHSFKVLIASGDLLQLKTVLEPVSEKHFEVEITGEGPNIEDVTASVDGGLEEGPLPLEITDLTAGTHTVEFRLGGIDGFRFKPYVCAFTIPVTAADPLKKISVIRAGKRLKVTGCKKVKQTN